MPPWRAVPGFGVLRDARRLSDHQIALLASWSENGAQRGDADGTMPVSLCPNYKWRLGEPDLVLRVPEPFLVPADGEDIYRYFVNPTGFNEDKVVTALEFSPDDPKVTAGLEGWVQSTGRHAEGTAVGFSKKKKGARSYYPLFSTFVQTREVFDVHDSNGARDFVVQCVDEIRSKLPKARIETRVDSAFFSEAIVDALDGAQVEFTALAPFERFPALKRMIEGRRRWRRIDEELSFLESQRKPDNWTERYRFLFIRTRVRRQNNEPIQLDFFVPDPTINLSVSRRRSSRRRTVGYSLGVRLRPRCIRGL